MFKKAFFIFIVKILAINGFSQVISYNSSTGMDIPGKSVKFLKDPTHTLTLDSVLQNKNWLACTRNVPNFLLTSSSIWISFDIKNETDCENLFFEIPYSAMDKVEFYEKNNGIYTSAVLSDSSAIRNRVIKNENYCFKINMPKDEIKRFYFKVENGDIVHVPMRIGTLDFINSGHTRKDIWFSIFTGILLAMLLANVFIYSRTRERSYIIYVIYIGVVYLTQANFQGYTLKWFLQEMPWAERYAVFILSAAVGIAAMAFMHSLLNISMRSNNVRIFTGIYLLSIILALLGLFQLSFLIIEINAAILASWMLIKSINLLKQGNKQAKNFLIAWSAFLVGVCIFVMKDFGIIPFNSFTFNIMTIGSAFETVLLSFALADKINILKREKEEADAERILTIENQNEVLEIKVHQRTAELEEVKDKIQAQYDRLRITQKQLVEAEKLAGLGQMTAGIAHELNNPINFVSSNVGPLHRDIEDVLEMLNNYAQLPDEATPEQLREVKEKYKKAGIDYVQSEIKQLLSGIEEGSRRTAEIVRGLRIFARADKDTLVSANVNECLQSTIVVMKSITKGQVTLNRELDLSLPIIECFPGN